MPPSKRRYLFRGFWKHLNKFAKTFRVPPEVGWELPKNRAEFFSERENAGSKEIGQRNFDFAQFLHVGDETRAFYAEEKIFRRRLVPTPIAHWSLQQVK